MATVPHAASPKIPLRTRVEEYFRGLQDVICSELENADGKVEFKGDEWTHATGGGGLTRVLEKGAIFEKAGVNFSSTTSLLTKKLAAKLNLTPQKVHASGVSLVIHPQSPMIPTVHMNVRYLEPESGEAWFGGGMDLTPFYLFDEDARHFHKTLKTSCDKHDKSFYPKFKFLCDGYFFIRHRNESRGIGGIFFDYLKGDPEKTFAFVKEAGNSFLESYLPIVERRKKEPWGKAEKEWQLIRRGRYAEFNLVYDRGTIFGLETEGRPESILMSLPPEVQWRYNFAPKPGSREATLLTILTHPKDWI
jgi:coproporphyrinogen III oxidase